MSYATAYQNTTSPTFLQVLQESLCNTAISIVNEPPSTALHQQRVRLAYQVLGDPTGWAARMAPGVCADGATGPASTDAQIDTRVSGVWNSYAP